MDSHPLTPGILEVAKAYEELRLSGKMPAEARRRLREKGRDFVLDHLKGQPDVVEVKAVAEVGGDRDLRAMAGWHGAGTVVTLWHSKGREGELILADDVRDFRGLRLLDVQGREMKRAATSGRIAVPFGAKRTTLLFGGGPEHWVRELLAKAQIELHKPRALWLQAEDAARIVGTMAKGSAAGVKEEGAFGDVVLCTARPNREKPEESFCEYRVEIPHEGRWTLWARVRYPSGSDESFGIAPVGEKVTLDGDQVLGNCGVNEKRWHWTGRGGGVTSVPPGQPITFTLPKGPFVFRIYPREGGGTAALNPRLDCLCLSDGPGHVPADAEARQGLAGLTGGSQ